MLLLSIFINRKEVLLAKQLSGLMVVVVVVVVEGVFVFNLDELWAQKIDVVDF